MVDNEQYLLAGGLFRWIKRCGSASSLVLLVRAHELGQRLDILDPDFNCDNFHDHFEDEQNPKLIFLSKQHTLFAGHRSGTNTHRGAFHEIDIWMWLNFPLIETLPKELNVGIRNG